MKLVLLMNKFFTSDNEKVKMEVPDGYCPNCWGRSEYGGKFYEFIQDRRFELDKKSPEIGWIQDYIEKNLKPIILVKRNDQLICPTCRTTYNDKDRT